MKVFTTKEDIKISKEQFKKHGYSGIRIFKTEAGVIDATECDKKEIVEVDIKDKK